MPRLARIAPKEYVYHILTRGNTLLYKNLSKDEGERRKKYREFVKGMIKKKGSMKGEMNRRAVYGSDNFIKEVAREYKVEAVIKPKGRPKKEENEDN